MSDSLSEYYKTPDASARKRTALAKPKPKRVNEVVLFMAVALPSKQRNEPGDPIAWYSVIDKFIEVEAGHAG